MSVRADKSPEPQEPAEDRGGIHLHPRIAGLTTNRIRTARIYRWRQILGKIRKKIPWRNGKRLRQLHDIFQCDIPLTTLNTTNVISMQPGSFGQLFLRVAAFITELAQREAKPGFSGACCHTPILKF